jgi:two-component system, sensor histidine kinase
MSTTPPAPFAILIVDDEQDQRSLLKAQLEKAAPGLRVDTADDGDKALAKLAETVYDLVFLDYRLPPTDGLDILEKIRQLHPKTSVVMTTAGGNEQVAVAAMKKGAMDYITQKDLRQTDLAQLLRRVVEIRNLVNQNMELRQVNQMKNEFIANVSHELRTPLTVVIGYANTMLDGGMGPLTPEQRKALGAMIERSEGLLSTLNNILRIREVQEGRKHLLLQPVDLAAMLKEQLARAEKDARRKKLKVSVEAAAEGAWVMADAETLGEVVENLLSNAIKFSHAEGALKVALAVAGGRAKLTVVDEGPGVPPEILPHVFDPFFAAHQGPTREYPGLGLGLPISKQIVETLGGRIWLESDGAGRGTTARLELPVCAKDAPPAHADARDEVRKRRVLVVEDNPDLVEVLMLFLAGVSKNLAIATARSGFEALDKIKDERPDLIVLDVMMPGMDGFEVLSRLRRLPADQRMPVMVLTGYADAVARASAAGADAVMLKPFEKKAFVQKVLELLQKPAPKA